MAAAADVELSHQFGPSAVVMLELRKQHLSEGEHYTAGPPLAYTEAGIARIRELLDLEKEEGARADQAPASQILMIVGLCHNPLFVYVRTPQGEKTAVQVRRHGSLRKGAGLLCTLLQGTWHCTQPGYTSRSQKKEGGAAA